MGCSGCYYKTKGKYELDKVPEITLEDLELIPTIRDADYSVFREFVSQLSGEEARKARAARIYAREELQKEESSPFLLGTLKRPI